MDTDPWPTWLSLDPTTGVISGTPTESAGQVDLYVTASNSEGSDTKRFYFEVYDKPTITLTVKNSSGTWVPHLSNILPDAYTSQQDEYLRFNTGDIRGYTVTSIEGVMPSGMDFQDNDNWGQFLIENLSEGTYSFTLVSRKYTDSEKTQFIGEDRKTVTMTVYSTPQYNGAPAFSIGNMTVGTAITPIDFSELFSGGKAPLKYTAEDGTYPQGLTLDPNTGILSGTPLIAGIGSSFRIFCTDANGKVADPVIYYGCRYLPQVALGTPSGASFLDSEGLDLKLDYPTLGGNVTLYYTTDGTDPEDSSTKKEAAPGATVKIGANIGVGNSVTVRVRAYQSTAEDDYQWSDGAKATYVSVKKPLAPTANWEDGTTFTTPLGVMLSCDTVGATIYYKLNGSTTYTIYTGKPIVLTKTTTLEVRSSLNNILSESVTYTYTKVAGVTVSGTIKSYGSASEAVTVTLLQGTNEVATKTLTGASGTVPYSQSYAFPAVPAGTYTLKVEKKGHAPWTEEITVDSTAITKDVTVYLWGDVNRDGEVTAADAQEIQRKAAGLSSVFDTDPNSAYCTLRADVNRDGAITAADAQEIQRKAAGLSSTISTLP